MFHIFKESCEKNGVDLHLLGFGKKWGGFSWRFGLVLEHLQTCEDDELVLVTDAFDTVVLKGPEEFEKRFKSYQTDKVFCLEGQADDYVWIARYYNSRVFGPPPVVNGGTYMGYAKALREFISSLDYRNSEDDQRLLTQRARKGDMVLDTDRRLFFMHGLGRQRDRMNYIPDTCLVSFPGSGETEELLKGLGYTYKSEPAIMSLKLTLKRILHYGPFFWREAAVLVGAALTVAVVIVCCV